MAGTDAAPRVACLPWRHQRPRHLAARAGPTDACHTAGASAPLTTPSGGSSDCGSPYHGATSHVLLLNAKDAPRSGGPLTRCGCLAAYACGAAAQQRADRGPSSPCQHSLGAADAQQPLLQHHNATAPAAVHAGWQRWLSCARPQRRSRSPAHLPRSSRQELRNTSCAHDASTSSDDAAAPRATPILKPPGAAVHARWPPAASAHSGLPPSRGGDGVLSSSSGERMAHAQLDSVNFVTGPPSSGLVHSKCVGSGGSCGDVAYPSAACQPFAQQGDPAAQAGSALSSSRAAAAAAAGGGVEVSAGTSSERNMTAEVADAPRPEVRTAALTNITMTVLFACCIPQAVSEGLLLLHVAVAAF